MVQNTVPPSPARSQQRRAPFHRSHVQGGPGPEELVSHTAEAAFWLPPFEGSPRPGHVDFSLVSCLSANDFLPFSSRGTQKLIIKILWHTKIYVFCQSDQKIGLFFTHSHWLAIVLAVVFFFLNLFLERGREGERVGEKHQCVVAAHTRNWGPGPQPRHVP